ncbi:WXG100-like domain-containing protein [Kitasatospora purpeofusca]|uniref:WXG100-like domain-containing protein n=1 Tax=Kitasatospora purpeofusca TaxID=67352 RepID=UPI00382D4FB6
MKYTDFRQFSHAELRAMVQALNPGEVMAAADPWRRAADTLKAIRTTLTRASTEAATSWEGSTSDAFHTRMLHLATTINTAASYANDAAITLKAVSEAIAEAKRNMPEEPSGWAQFKDGVGDTFSSLFGADDEDSRTDLANQKKAEAATVLQTLAMHYRTAAPMLKPPPPPPKPGSTKPIDDVTEISPDDTGSSGYAAVGGLLGSAGAGTGTGPLARSGGSAVADPRVSARGRSTPSENGLSLTKTPSTPTDSGVKGGVAAPPTKAAPGRYGGGVVVDGAMPSPTPSQAAGGQSASGLSGTSILGTPGNNGNQLLPSSAVPQSALQPQGGGLGDPHPAGISQPFTSMGKQGPGAGAERPGSPAARASRGGEPGRTAFSRSGAIFGAEGMPSVTGGGSAPGASAKGRRPTGGGASHGGGPVAGVGDRSGRSVGGKQAFTEGGSGVGARARTRPETGTGGPMTQSPMVPLGAAGRRRQEDEEGRKRPDYLVEDEETWASDGPVNPNVVE